MPRGRRGPKKPKDPKPPQEWRRLPEVEALLEGLVAKHHKHLERAKIAVLGKPKAGKRMGKRVEVTVRKPSAGTKALLADEVGDLHYLIEIGLDLWGELNQKQKRRLLDEALCHFTGLDEKGSWGLIGPDVELFIGHFKRWGPHVAHEEMLVEAIKQLDMFPEQEG